LPQITVQELNDRLDNRDLQILDVRRQGEWDAGHIATADWYPLDRFKAGLPALGKNTAIAVHCKSGYRSMIAASLLQRAGYNVINVIGGFDAWEKAQLPAAVAEAVSAH
jgi:hydroxyacylglutathione hydrolase